MKFALLLAVVYLLHCDGMVVIQAVPSIENDRPIIGVLAQEKYAQENCTSYIAASYVKAIEASGARVVPIMIGQDRSYYEDIMSKINGVLFPGGGVYFNQSHGYADAGQDIYEIAKNLNDVGDYFPIWGTCLGFELLISLASGRPKRENMITCSSHKSLPLNFTKDYRTSKLFKDIPPDVQELLANEDVTVNHHQFCIDDENLKFHNISNDWRVTSHSVDDNGKIFISSIEHKRYPFYGVQFHPEKVAFEWKLSTNVPHTRNALKANRYFMDYFVGECRKNFHSYKDVEEENKYLIYNYAPVFTGAQGQIFQQIYVFKTKCIVVHS